MNASAAVVLNVIVFLIIAAFAVRFIVRRQSALARATPIATPDGLQIPVNGIYTRGGFLGGFQRNSLRPEFTVGRDAIRFKAVSRQELPFAAIAHVEARPRRNGWKLIFVSHVRSIVVVADIIGETSVLAALRALPDDLPRTPQAALLRDGSAATATEGLQIYSGPTF